ncbi:uncharacterized protein LOC143192855 isoform X2 [Rhynchophorus ferrugineus]|uniref:uncharacterized protein LOC143192855 isoform X2 n=1 Tax=Rhynchophorus ferrugineus TaxID=354439 RepID=UPI003FCEE2CE
MTNAQSKRSLHLLKPTDMPSTSYQVNLKENTMSTSKKTPKDRATTIKDILDLNEEVKAKKYKESLVVKQGKNKVTFHYLSPRRDCTQCLSKNRKRLLDFYKKNAYKIGTHSQKKRYLSYYSKNITQQNHFNIVEREKEKIIVKDQNINDGLQDKSLSLFNLVKYQTASSNEFVPTNRYKFEAKQRPDVYKVIEDKEKKRLDPYPLEMFNEDLTTRDLETARSMAPQPKTVFDYYKDVAITDLPAAADNLEYDMVGCPDCGSGKKEAPCKINVNKKKKKDDKCKKPKKEPPCKKRNPCDQGHKDYRASSVSTMPMEACHGNVSEFTSKNGYITPYKAYDGNDNKNHKHIIATKSHKSCSSFGGHSLAQLQSTNKNVYFTEDLFSQKNFLDNIKKVNSSQYLEICKMDRANNLQQQKITSSKDDEVYFIHPKDDLNERLNSAFGSTPKVEINEKSKDMIAKAIKNMIQPIIEKEFLKYDEVKEAVERMEKSLDNCLKTLSKSLHIPIASPLSMVNQNHQTIQVKYPWLKHHQEQIIDKNHHPEITDPTKNKFEYKDPRKISSIGIPSDSTTDDYKEPESENLGVSFSKFNRTNTVSKIKIPRNQKMNPLNIVSLKQSKFICKSKDINKPEHPCSKKDDSSKDKDKKASSHKNDQHKDPCAKKEDPCKKKEDPCKKKEDPCKKKEDPCKKKEDPCKKKEDPCKKKEDPCKKKEDPCKKKEDPCKKKEDPCKKKEDPCKKKEDPCKKKEDPCKKKEDPCKKKEDPCMKKEDPCKKKEDPCKKKEDPCKKNEDPCKKKEDPCKKKEDPCEKKDPCVKASSINDKWRKEDSCNKDDRCKNVDPCQEKENHCVKAETKTDPCKQEDPCKTTCDPCAPIETERIDPCSNFCNRKEDPCSLPAKDTCPEPSYLDPCGELSGGEVKCRKSKIAEKECCQAPPTCKIDNPFSQEEIKCHKTNKPKIKLPQQPEPCHKISSCQNIPMPESCPLKPECEHKCPEAKCPTCFQNPCTVKQDLIQKSQTPKIQPCSRQASENGFAGMKELAKCDYTKNTPCSSCEVSKPTIEAFIQINPEVTKPVAVKEQKPESVVSEKDRRYCSKEALTREMDEISRRQALDESRKQEEKLICKKPVIFGESSRKSWSPVKIQNTKMGDLKTIPDAVKTEKPESLKKSKSHEPLTETHKNKGIVETCSNKITDLCMMIIRKHKGGKKAAPIVVTLSRSQPNLSGIHQTDGPGMLFDGGSSGQNGNGNKYDCRPFGLFGGGGKKSGNGKGGKSKGENFLKLRDDCNNTKQNKSKKSDASCKKAKSEPSIKCKNDKHSAEEEDPYNCVKRKRSKANKNDEMCLNKTKDKKKEHKSSSSKHSGEDHCKKKDDHSKRKEDPCKKKDDPCKKKEDPCKKKEDQCKKKEDPCKKKEDPCKKKEDHCKKKEDPCKKKDQCKEEDPCKKKEDPCKKKVDHCKKKEDPCKKKEDPCKKKEDPCKKEEDPCKKKEDPCKKKDDPCKKKEDPCKKKEDPCKKKEDPCKKKDDHHCKKETHGTEKKDPCTSQKGKDHCQETNVKECSNKSKDNDHCKQEGDPCQGSKKNDHAKRAQGKKLQIVICKKDHDKKTDSCKKPNKDDDVCKKTKSKDADCGKEDDPCKKFKSTENPCKSAETGDKNDEHFTVEKIDCSEASSKVDDICEEESAPLKKECKDPCNKPVKRVAGGKRNKYPWNTYCKKKKGKKLAKEKSEESEKNICCPKKTEKSEKDICPKKPETCRTQEKLLSKMKEYEEEKHEANEDEPCNSKDSKDQHKSNVQEACRVQCSKKAAGSHKSRNKDCKTKQDNNVTMKKSEHKKKDHAKNKKKCLPFWGISSIGEKKLKSVQRCSAIDDKLLNVTINEDAVIHRSKSMNLSKNCSLGLNNSAYSFEQNNSLRLFHISSLFQKADQDSSPGDSRPKSAMDLFPNRKKIDNFIGIKHYCLIKNSKEQNSNKIKSEPLEDENKCNPVISLRYYGPDAPKNNNQTQSKTKNHCPNIKEKYSNEEKHCNSNDNVIPCIKKKILMSCDIKKKRTSASNESKGKVICKELKSSCKDSALDKQKTKLQVESKGDVDYCRKEKQSGRCRNYKENQKTSTEKKICKEKTKETIIYKQSNTKKTCIKSEIQSNENHGEPKEINSTHKCKNSQYTQDNESINYQDGALKSSSSKIKSPKIYQRKAGKPCEQTKKQNSAKDIEITSYKKTNIGEYTIDVFNKTLKSDIHPNEQNIIKQRYFNSNNNISDSECNEIKNACNLRSETNIKRKNDDECKVTKKTESCSDVNETNIKSNKKKCDDENGIDYSNCQLKQQHFSDHEKFETDNNKEKCLRESIKICSNNSDKSIKDMSLLKQCAVVAKIHKDHSKKNTLEKSKCSNIKSIEGNSSIDKETSCENDKDMLADLKDHINNCMDNSGETMKDMEQCALIGKTWKNHCNNINIQDTNCSDKQLNKDNCDNDEISSSDKHKDVSDACKEKPDELTKDMGLLRQCALIAKRSKDHCNNINTQNANCSDTQLKKDDIYNELISQKDRRVDVYIKDVTDACKDTDELKLTEPRNNNKLDKCPDKSQKEYHYKLDQNSLDMNCNAHTNLEDFTKCTDNDDKPIKDMGLLKQCAHMLKQSKDHSNKSKSKKLKHRKAMRDCCYIDKKDQSVQKGLKDLTNMDPGICDEPIKDMGILSQCTMMTRKSKTPIIEPISDESAKNLFCRGEETNIFQVKKLGTGEKLVCVEDITEHDLEEDACHPEDAQDVDRVLKCTIVNENNKQRLICMAIKPGPDENEDCSDISTQHKVKITSNKLVCRKIMSYNGQACEPEIVCQIMQVEEIKLVNENDKKKTVEKRLTYKDLMKKKKNEIRNLSKKQKKPDKETKNEICKEEDDVKNETKEDECQ